MPGEKRKHEEVSVENAEALAPAAKKRALSSGGKPAASGTQPNMPGIIRGSTVQILRTLYQAQIGLQDAKPDDALILLDAHAASSNSALHTVDLLNQARDTIDDVIAKFKPEDLKAFGVGYKQQNTKHSDDISALDQTLVSLREKYTKLQQAQAEIRQKLAAGSTPSKDEIIQLTATTNDFRKDAREYLSKYAALAIDLKSLYGSVSKYVPQSEVTAEHPVARLGGIG